MKIDERVWLALIFMICMIIAVQIGIAHGRRLQLEEDIMRFDLEAGESIAGHRWVCTSRDTIDGSPGLVVFTIRDYVWHTVTLYAIAHGDTITSVIIEKGNAP